MKGWSGFVLATLIVAGPAVAQSRPPANAYLMEHAEEIALARSAAPAAIADSATILVLTRDGYREAVEGRNGFVCYVARSTIGRASRDIGGPSAGFYDPSIRAPHCMSPEAARTVHAWHALTTRMALQGEGPEAIDRAVDEALAAGRITPPDGFAIAYMFSGHQHLGASVGPWKPHMMVYVPFLRPSMVGPAEILSDAPQVLDAGTPWAVLVIPARHPFIPSEG